MKKPAHPHNDTDVQMAVVTVLRNVRDHGQVDIDNPAGVYARQADELAAMVESLIRDERERHAKAVRALEVLAAALGEQHGELDELAAQLGGEGGESR